jgi:hypothetical protein
MLVKMDVPVLSEIGFVLVDITRFFWGKPQSPNISFLTSAAHAFEVLSALTRPPMKAHAHGDLPEPNACPKDKAATVFIG